MRVSSVWSGRSRGSSPNLIPLSSPFHPINTLVERNNPDDLNFRSSAVIMADLNVVAKSFTGTSAVRLSLELVELRSFLRLLSASRRR